ncbi:MULTISPECIES: hypothetical protein [Microcoleaceae]|uniref:hypothetical protein n=1 Tax=Microcoleaceae TaxID=1892252 RepID=UPI001D1419B1|nr:MULTISPECIES: hypothetical protein [unclassified Tychonema]
MISDVMTSMNVLRQEAAAIGITDAEARKYGDLRHKRTWSLAIEHHLSMQDFAVGEALEEDRAESDSSRAIKDSQPLEFKDCGIQLTANLGESPFKIENRTSPLASPPQSGSAIGQPNNSDRLSHQNRGFKQVVQNHIKALTIASTSRTIQINSQVSNWVCPECYPEVESGCHLCAGEGYISDIAAIGWTLAYMEMLGCSAREIEPLRNFSSSFNILEINLKICVAVKKSTEVLARTEKWVIGNW